MKVIGEWRKWEMGWFKKTKDEALAYARERAQRLGNDQVVMEVDGGYRVGSEKKMYFFYPSAQFYHVRFMY
jgi:hypothetical protein